MFFDLEPEKAVLGDLNPELVNALNCVRNHSSKISTLLSNLKKSKSVYLSLRSQKPEELEKLERAARFIYLNRFCFNGIYRTNLAGQFNVPYAGEGTGDLPTKEELLRCSKLLKRANIKTSDFESLIEKNVSKNSFVYLDPPYATAKRRIFREYHENAFATKDIDRLESLLDRIDASGAYFLLSYASCGEMSKSMKKWHHERFYVMRNISGFAKSRRNALEVLISNFKPADA